jgi:galactokinase
MVCFLIKEKFQELYGRAPSCAARAPGRIEFIGNHTDYNGGPVLGAAINRYVSVAVAPRDDGLRNFYSDFTGLIETLPENPMSRQTGRRTWLNYPLGVLEAFPGFGLEPPEGFDFLTTSDLPAGSGLSSSAALELASALAFLALTDQSMDRLRLVQLAKHAENHFVGVPCGILDQGVSAFGQENHLVWIDCITPTFAQIPLPSEAHFWIFNTHTKHALVDGLYAERHQECKLAAGALHVSLLVHVTQNQLDAAGQGLDPTIYKRARHVIDEIARVGQTVAALRDGDLRTTGELLTASHRSSQYLFENSTEELDFLVDQLTQVPSVYGARLSGGGFGGSVMALTQPSFQLGDAARISSAYHSRFRAEPEILQLLTADGAGQIELVVRLA